MPILKLLFWPRQRLMNLGRSFKAGNPGHHALTPASRQRRLNLASVGTFNRRYATQDGGAVFILQAINDLPKVNRPSGTKPEGNGVAHW
jgi:hypothetical protein